MAVEPNAVELARLSDCIRNVFAGASVECFRDPLLAYQYGVNNRVDALYIVAEMPRLSGFDMARRMKKRYPGISIHFIWENDDLRQDALRAGIEDYIIKPVTAAKLTAAKEEAENDWEGKR